MGGVHGAHPRGLAGVQGAEPPETFGFWSFKKQKEADFSG